jgi:hypothetical protein
MQHLGATLGELGKLQQFNFLKTFSMHSSCVIANMRLLKLTLGCINSSANNEGNAKTATDERISIENTAFIP